MRPSEWYRNDMSNLPCEYRMIKSDSLILLSNDTHPNFHVINSHGELNTKK